MSPNDDQFLISQVLTGNTAAFSMLVERYKDLAYTIAYKILRNHEDAEETAMDAFLKAFQALKALRGMPGFLPGYTVSYLIRPFPGHVRKGSSSAILIIIYLMKCCRMNRLLPTFMR